MSAADAVRREPPTAARAAPARAVAARGLRGARGALLREARGGRSVTGALASDRPPGAELHAVPLPGRETGTAGGLDTGALKAGHVTLVNVFASWCAECHDEHGLLMSLAASPRMKDLGIPIDGIAYKDKAEDARRYLGTKGDPYASVGDDRSGRTAIDFGVYGVPETFVVKGDGTIAYKLIGPVTAENLGTLEAEIDKAAR